MGCMMAVLSVLPMVPKIQRLGVSELESMVGVHAGLEVEVAELQPGGARGLFIVAGKGPGGGAP